MSEHSQDALLKKIEELERELAQTRDGFAEREKSCQLAWEKSRRNEERLQIANIIINKSPVILFRRRAGEDATLEFVSENISQFGYRARDFLDGAISFRDIVHPEDAERVGREVEFHTERDADEYLQEYRILTKGREVRWLTDKTVVMRDKAGNKLFHQGILADITARKKAEDQLQAEKDKLNRILETAAQGFILMDLDLRYVEINESYCTMLGYTREELLGKRPYDVATPEFKLYLRTHGEQLLRREKRKFEGSLIHKDGHTVPVMIHANTLRDENGIPIGNVAFVSDLTEQKKALQLAEEVQKSLLPTQAPTYPGLDIAGRSLSSDVVGGDYFDYLEGVDGLNIAVGDIAGHGVDAALLMTSARAFMRMRASQPGSPAQIVDEMNRHLAADLFGTGRFMTLFLVRFDPENGRASWVRAGHDPALIYCPVQDTFEEMGGSGLPLGVDEDINYEEQFSEMYPGQIIAIGTDGIWEAESPDREMFGKERFRDLIRKNAEKPSAAILDAIYREIQHFTGELRQRDDITLVIIKYRSE